MIENCLDWADDTPRARLLGEFERSMIQLLLHTQASASRLHRPE